MALQIRRGLEADRLSITPAAGELLYVTDTGNIYVGDGTTAGGGLVTGDVVDDTSPQLGGNLDLNGNNIVGTGNINIDGTITATGNINLGDASGDNVNVLGSVNTSLIPKNDSAVDIGSAALRWRNGYFSGLNVDGQIDAISINSKIIADDSTISFDPSTGLFIGNLQGNLTGDVTGNVTGNLTGNAFGNHTGTFTGELIGSVFADDSSVMVDGINNVITATTVNAVTSIPTLLKTNEINDSDTSGVLTIDLSTPTGTTVPRIELESDGANGSGLYIFTRDTTRTLAGGDNIGRILFRSIDAGGTETPAVMIARKDEFILAVGAKGDPETTHFATATGNMGVGIDPTATDKLAVGGNILATGTISGAAFKGTLAADDSTILIDATTGSMVLANVDLVGDVGNTPVDTGTVDSWLEVTVNGATKYIPLYD